MEDAAVVHGDVGQMSRVFWVKVMFLHVEGQGLISYFDAGVSDIDGDYLFHYSLIILLTSCPDDIGEIILS